MFTKRIIPCLDVRDGRVVKGVNFVNLKDAGDPVEIARAYDQAGADELVFLDITASHEGRDTVVDMVQAGSAMKAGTMMYALGHPVGILHPNEYIMSVELFRQGEKIGKVHNNPLVDPNRLEQFFELQENDVLRITLNRPQTYEVRDAYVAYDINVSTGEVTTLTERDLFGSPENPIIR